MQTIQSQEETPSKSLPLVQLQRGRNALLTALDLTPREADRLMELGLIPGCRILVEGKGPGGSCLCRVGGCVLALRRETAEKVEVSPTD